MPRQLHTAPAPPHAPTGSLPSAIFPHSEYLQCASALAVTITDSDDLLEVGRFKGTCSINAQQSVPEPARIALLRTGVLLGTGLSGRAIARR